MRKDVICPYCDQPARFVNGSTVYPHRPDLHHKAFYVCEPCEARVGCHEATGKPFGRLANAELRRLKIDAHAAFDPLWKHGPMKRTQAYAWLARRMNIAKDDCHIGMMDEAQCRRVIEVCLLKRKKDRAK